MHEAGVVAGGAGLRAGFEDGRGLVGEHGGGDVGVFDGEGSAEAAAAGEFVGREFDEVEAADGSKQAEGAVRKAEVAEAVAAGVVGDAMGVVGAYIGEVEAAGEELGELVDAGEEIGEGGGEGGIVDALGHLGVVVADHGDARGGWDDDGFGVGELVDEAFEQREGFRLVASVVVHLSAAGLAGGEGYGVA